MQRSGTNMVMDLLEASYATRVFHESDARAFQRYQMRERTVIRGLVRGTRAPVFVVKALCELDVLSDLMAEFEPATTLWIVRHWHYSVNSALRSFGNFVPQWRRLARGTQADWRGRGMSAATRALIGGLYRADATEADGAAIMWYYRNVLFFEHAFDQDPRVRLLPYESLVRNPWELTKALYDSLGLDDWSPKIPAKIHTDWMKTSAPPKVAPEIMELCNGLYARLASLAAREFR
jgi:hypothetical protein